MTALSEALVSAQRRAIAALEKALLAGEIDAPQFTAALNTMGLDDVIDQGHLEWALHHIKTWGASAPVEGNGAPPDAPPQLATDKQKALIVKLQNEQGHPVIASQDLNVMPKARAQEIIDALLAGTYDPATMDVPF